MKLFLDTANIEEIREINRWGVLGGVTTNPSLVAKEADDPERVWKEILTEVEGPISLETTELEADPMYEQGVDLAQMAPNAVVKVPMTPNGLIAGKRLVSDGIRINVTLVFSPAQAILAAEIGAFPPRVPSTMMGVASRIDRLATASVLARLRRGRSSSSRQGARRGWAGRRLMTCATNESPGSGASRACNRETIWR